MTKQETKNRILAESARLIHERGFSRTGIQEILEAADVPKGSFYFYFSSKEELGIQVIDLYMKIMGERLDRHFFSVTRPGLVNLEAFFNEFQDYFKENELSRGCPIGNLAQELGDSNPRIREKLKMALDEYKEALAICLKSAKDNGEIVQDINEDNMADFIVNSWEGALIRMKAEKSLKPLKIFQSMVVKLLSAK